MHTSAILGPAGSGKSTILKKQIGDDPNYAILTATTGIAAINLGEGVTTINSALGFFDLASLQKAYERKWLMKRFINMSIRGVKNIIIDEVSMLSGDCLDLIYKGARDAEEEINNDWRKREDGAEGIGLILVGDFVQLPAVNGNFAFEAQCWPKFEANLTKLTKIWRQDSQDFQELLNMCRAGRGVDVAVRMNRLGVKTVTSPQEDFEGTTLFPVNTSVDKFNRSRLEKLETPTQIAHAYIWGKPRGEWKNIPGEVEFKQGALIMILANDPTGCFEYVNGELATVESDPEYSKTFKRIIVKTQRGKMIILDKVKRTNVVYEEPQEVQDCWMERQKGDKGFFEEYKEYKYQVDKVRKPYYDPMIDGWVVGAIDYLPIRLAYASTFHKVQGLTLDKVQIDCRGQWAGNPSMMYVALSRCRSLEGLQIVTGDGGAARIARRVCTDRKVMRWV